MNSGFAAKIKTSFPFFPAALVSRVRVLFLGGFGQAEAAGQSSSGGGRR